MEITNQLKKYVKSLHANKHRQKYNKFIAEGPKICSEFLDANKYQLEYLFCTSEWYELNEKRLLPIEKNKVYIIKEKVLSQISNLNTANKVLLVLDQGTRESTDISNNSWTLYLDKIQDPGNMGTILRIADWYGISLVISSDESVNYYNPKVIQAGMGAHNRVQLDLKSSDQIIKSKAPAKYGLALNGKALTKALTLEPGIIIIGNESKGISPTVLAACDELITIPRIGGAESLNASVACGIACQLLINQ